MDKVFVVIRTSEPDPVWGLQREPKCVGVFTTKKNARQAMAASATREARLQNTGNVMAEVHLGDFTADVIIHINDKKTHTLHHYQLSQHVIR